MQPSMFFKKWHLSLQIIPILGGVFVLKLLFHTQNWEFITLNALFTSLIAGTTFLIGFLVTGVISDYKESEKIPGELAASLESLFGEARILAHNQTNKDTLAFLENCQILPTRIIDWFHKRERTRAILGHLNQLDSHFAQLEPITQANFLTRMKNEQSAVRRMIIRVDNIRDLSFIPSAYAIAEVLAFFVVVGLLVLRLDPFHEALFFTLLVSFLMVYMIFLIKDLDNPFNYAGRRPWGTAVSIKPLHDLSERIAKSPSLSKNLDGSN